MRNLIKRPLGRAAELQANQKGITGLETAIELIAFVVVASVFAFAVLSTGLQYGTAQFGKEQRNRVGRLGGNFVDH